MNKTFTRRAGQVAAALCAASLSATVAGCAPMAASIGATTAIGLSPPGLDRYYSQQLDWGACDGFATNDEEKQLYAAPALQCARMEVPLDYGKPKGKTAQIAVLRHATDNPNRIGSLVVNPGGPGGSGVEMAAGLGKALDGFVFDIVGFDPRGIGASTPKLDCLTPSEEAAEVAEAEAEAASSAVPSAEEIEQEARDYITKCVERSGGVDVLANAGTRDVARDMDVLRAVLGENKLNFLGMSYGTRIGTTYAELFPRNVRAMVLDGVMDPNQSVPDRREAQSATFQKAFEAYAADCAKAADCPLGTDPTKATAAFQALARPLVENPAPAGKDRTLTHAKAVEAVTHALYSPDRWPALTAGLTELKSGNGERLFATIENDSPYVEDDGAIVNCADNGDRFTDRAQVAEHHARLIKAMPYADSGTSEDVAAFEPCDLWPAPASSTTHLPQVDGLPTVLVVSTTIDPATPYEAGVAVADELNGRLLTFEGIQHTASLSSPCAAKIAFDYLVNLNLPAEGTRCSATAEGTK